MDRLTPDFKRQENFLESDRGRRLFNRGFVAGLILGSSSVGVLWLNSELDIRETANRRPPAEISTSGPEETSGIPGSPAVRFEFPYMLPNMEVSVAGIEREPSSPTNEETDSDPSVDNSKSHEIQSGSFRQRGDAERLKAEIALLGVESTIREAILNSGRRYYRVRSGPFHSGGEMRQVFEVLAMNGIDPMIVSVLPRNE